MFSSLFVMKTDSFMGKKPVKKTNSRTDSTALSFLNPVYPVDSPPGHNPGAGDPATQGGGTFQLNPPSNYQTIYDLDDDSDGFNIHEQVGGIDVKPPSYLSMEDYMEIRRQQGMKDYWKTKQGNTNDDGKPAGLGFTIPVNDPKLNDIFGGGAVEIRPNGTALLEFSMDMNRMKNPSLPLRQQRTANFNFDQQIQLNVVGKIGNKLRLNANWDTEATFDFENQFKIQHNGSEDEILQTIEAGNVSLPLKGSLIQGGQNLFGIKVAMKFGPVLVTAIASQQKGKTQSVNVEGGSQVTDYEKRADDYDDNRHFFMAHHFRSRYDYALENLSNINSGYRITRIEVWQTNSNNASIVNNRNAVGFLDLGEQELQKTPDKGIGNVFNPKFQNSAKSPYYPDNDVNTLYQLLTTDPNVRKKSKIDAFLGDSINGLGMVNGVDYEKVENMRMLQQGQDYTFHPQLGYISLNSQLQPNQVLFVAYQYMVNGQTFQVGEFSQDKPVEQNELLYLKMLKPSSVQPTYNGVAYPGWDLMMKNIYNIGGFGLRPDNFDFQIYYQSPTSAGDRTVLPGSPIKDVPLLQVFNVDKLTNNSTPSPDNKFDFIEGVTIMADKGMIIFPVIEPFGDFLVKKMGGGAEDSATYAFPQLYRKTKMDAQQLHQDVDRYVFKGSYKSASSSDISLNALNITQGSVVVTANGMTLQEGTDYQVDYQIGRVKILNQGLLTSGQQIRVTFETNTLFGIQSKTLVGTRFDFNFNKDIQLGATVLHLNERPLTNKINIGDEPISNTIVGADVVLRKESNLLTKWVDKLPLIQTKEISSITGAGEVAGLLPGHPNSIAVKDENGNVEEGIAYLDDFESAKTPFDLSGNRTWFLASFPGNNGNNDLYDPSLVYANTRSSGFSRAKLAWYSIDPNFYYGNTVADFPDDDLSNHYTRQVGPQEIFPKKDVVVGDNLLRTLDLHYIPTQRGPYNYVTDPSKLKQNGLMKRPDENWAGIMRKTNASTDFEASNYEFLEFWLLDPFIDNPSNDGELFINLGKVSEDVLPDGGRAVENGLPEKGDYSTTDTTDWGIVPKTPPTTPAFSNDVEARSYQDAGLDGVRDEDEPAFFKDFLDSLQNVITANAFASVAADPSNDNYKYFRGDDYDAVQAGILERYLNVNGTEGNTPAGNEASQNGYSTQGSANPDTEDLNGDLTLNKTERYWEYRIKLSKSELENLSGFAVDKRVAEVELPNKSKEKVSWYQFRIPLSSGTSINNITNFKSIDFVRMYLTGFEDDVILRFGKLQLVSTSWRTYKDYLGKEDEIINGGPNDPLTSFQIGTVNIEENSEKSPFPYVVPPNVLRQQIVGGIQQQGVLQNEQAMVLKSCYLQDGDARAAYKLLPQRFDLRSYKRVKLWVHAEPGDPDDAITSNFQNKGDASFFIRLGTDNNENYYEYEIPLTPPDAGIYGSTINTDVWLQENQIDLVMDWLNLAKSARTKQSVDQGKPEIVTARWGEELDVILQDYINSGQEVSRPGHKIYVRGTPKLSEVRTMMVGLRNPDDGNGPICVETWVNELRVVDFNEKAGMAATARVNIKLADLGNISASGLHRTPGFGGLEQRINARSREFVDQYDVSANLNMGKFFPTKWGIELPVYATYGERVVNPQFNPQETDVLKNDYLTLFNENNGDRDSVKQSLQTYQRNRSISLNNIRKTRVQAKPGANTNRPGPPKEEGSKGTEDKKKDNKPRQPRFWDVENFAVSFSVSEVFSRDYQIESRYQVNHRASIQYSYNFKPKLIQPFKKWKAKNPISSFNFYLGPKSLSMDISGNRSFEENNYRSPAPGQKPLATNYFRNFIINRNYRLRWDLTKSLSFNFNASNTGRVDEPLRDIYVRDTILPNGNLRVANNDSIWDNLLSFGRRSLSHKFDTLGNFRGLYQNGKDHLINMGRTTTYNHSLTVNYVLPFDQWKFTKWISGTVNYNGSMNWTAAPDNLPTIGNTLGNQRGIQGNVRLNMNNFYSLIPGVKNWVDAGQQGGRRNTPATKPKPTVKNEKEESDTTKADPFYFLKLAGKELVNIIASVKNVDLTYNLTNSTLLPGYLPNTDNFGMDFNHYYYVDPGTASTDSFFKSTIIPPGYDFLAGWQVDRNVLLDRGTNQGWLSRDPRLSASFAQTMNEQLTGRTSMTLFKNLKIDLNVNKSRSENYNSLIRFDDTTSHHVMDNQLLTGQYQISYIFMGTAFEPNKVDDPFSKAWQEFSNNRSVISNRLGARQDADGIVDPEINASNTLVNSIYRNGYTGSSQDVLIPAFLAAYGPGKASSIGLTAFPALPLPNWQVNWNGLQNLPGLKKVFNQITLKHAYRGSYSVGSYSSNLKFQEFSEVGNQRYTLEKNYLLSPDTTIDVWNYQSQNIIQTISITESFAPLVGVNMTWNNGLSTGFDYKTSRNLNFNLVSAQLNETRTQDVTLSLTWRKDKLNKTLHLFGRDINLKNSLNARLEMTIRDRKTRNRKLDSQETQGLNGGNFTFILKPTIDYTVNQRMNVMLFLEQNVNRPYISTSFPTSFTSVGFRIRFTLQ
ncbi:MAG: cell surface protein SprA [Bacteroidia bacterium]|nr:cell surface protein SprA [Bacteroidia bacterium]